MLKYIVIMVLLGSTQAAVDLPPGIKMCPKMEDAEAFNKCALEVIDKIGPHLAKGIPSLNVPPMEPLYFPVVEDNRNLGILNVNFQFKNFKIFGFTNSTFTDFKADTDKLTLTAKAKVPILYFSGDYNIQGKIFMVPLGGIGKFKGEVRNVTYTIIAQGKNVTDEDGEMRVEVASFKIHFQIPHGKVRLEAPDRYLRIARAMQNVFNYYSRGVLRIASPIVNDIASKLTGNIVKDAISTFTKEDLIPSK